MPSQLFQSSGLRNRTMHVERYECDLPAECYRYAEEALGETKEVREQSLSEIYKWLDQNPNINADRRAKSILHFLRGAKFRIEKAKNKIVK